MASNFPGALDTATQQPSPLATTELDAAGFLHDEVHTNHSTALIALQTKMGISASTPTTIGHALTVSATGTTVWAAVTSVGTLSALTVTGAITAGSLDVTGAITAGSLVAPIAINAQTGTTYTFVAADAGKLVTSSNGSAQTITIPPNSSVAFAIGTQIMVQNIGSANATLAQGSGVTIQSKDSAKQIDGQFAAATCIKTATDTWTLIGALA